MQKGFKLFKVIGIQISLDYTWFIIFALVAWTLSQGYFPSVVPGLAMWIYIAMGVVSSLLLFASILLHELSHSYVANRLGMDIRGITLFIFGGIAELSREPDDPRMELKIAIAGPIASGVLAILFWLIKEGLTAMALFPLVASVCSYLVIINIVVVIFNMIPGFPLDGGRVLRAIWWMKSGDLQRATMVAGRVGKGFALFLIFFGILQTFTGNIIGGLWMVFIGIFLQQAAESGYREVLIKNSLSGIRVGDVMTREVVTVHPDDSLQVIVDDYLFRHHCVSFPVVAASRLVGMLNLGDIRAVPKEKWRETRVRDVMEPVTQHSLASPEETAIEVLSKMATLGVGRFPVVHMGKLVGIISRRDIMKLMAFKRELGS
ncbi:MAG: site-2 protease family protein [Zetaproteobacteria bacterium]|nr:site-2 protease family protein [Zetaproteobacteria bacterium]